MKKRIVAITLIFSLLLSVTGLSAETSAATQLASLLQKTNTFQANFVQRTLDNKNNLIQTSQGTMQFIRPMQFRWETLKPTHQIVIANNQWLWIYDVDLMQVTKQRMNQEAITPARILSGDTKELLTQFDVTMTKTGSTKVFYLHPQKKQSTWQQASIHFNGSTLQGLSIINALLQKNNFTFSAVKTNIHLSPELFQFTPPKGVDVLES